MSGFPFGLRLALLKQFVLGMFLGFSLENMKQEADKHCSCKVAQNRF